ncbi:MAG: glycine cleavage system aminomethyltransferase GcvT [Victivallales bacterium]|nr:glycine cleavage system aminomethyltransferase GcvT [Victivallales bacterium]
METPTGGNIRQTPLKKEHFALGARMVPFAGWEMPVQYGEGIIAEHLHTRSAASLFDICHMGEFRLRGTGLAEAMDKIFPRPVSSQAVGSCRYNFLLTDRATVVDDLIVYRIGIEEFYIVVNAGCIRKDFDRLSELLPENITIQDESDFTAKLDLQGPGSADVLADLGFGKRSLPQYYNFIGIEIAGIPVLLSRTGYTGELGFEIYFHSDHAVRLWTLILKHPSVKPAGLGARDTLRLEMAYPLYGHELDDQTTPLEAGFGRMIIPAPDRNFPGIQILRNSPPAKKLVGIELEGRRTARQGAQVIVDNEPCGTVSSGTFSPSLSHAIALAYVSPEISSSPGEPVELAAGNTRLQGKFSGIPFFKSGSAKKNVA